MTPAVAAALDRLHAHTGAIRLAAASLRSGRAPAGPLRVIRAHTEFLRATLADLDRALTMDTASPARLPGDAFGPDGAA